MRFILGRLADSGLKHYLELEITEWNLQPVLEFYYKSRIEGLEIVSTVRGVELRVTEEAIHNPLRLPQTGLVNPDDEKPEDFAALFSSLKKDDCAESYKASIKKTFLKDEYRLLADILSKFIEGKTGGHDTLTQHRFILINHIINRQPIN